MMTLLWVWTIGVTIMWASAKVTMKQRGRQDVAGEYKAVFELADAMHDQLSSVATEEAQDARQMKESTLRQRITKDLRGGAVAYDTALLSKQEGVIEDNEWTLKAWARRELWWLIALVASIVIDVVCIRAFVIGLQRTNLFVFWALPLALIFAMYVGTTHSSRGMVLLWVALVVCVLPAIVLRIVIQMLYQM